jgi:acyl-coenzyme A synthetase/AMP-(fatty) acid ligase
MQPIPSLSLPENPNAPFALFQKRIISRGDLQHDVEELAARLPERSALFNLCKNRYLFCLTLLAAAQRGQTCLLPPSERPETLLSIATNYPDAYLACEQAPATEALPWFPIIPPSQNNNQHVELHNDWPNISLIAFTSGSTGLPKPCSHQLRDLGLAAQIATTSLGLNSQQSLMLSTTPPQHMYGLETSVFWPLYSNLLLYDAHPFYPTDIRNAISTAPMPCILATTPTHLRVLSHSDDDTWPPLAGLISATDQLSPLLANTIANKFNAELIDLYGSTETLSLAYRRPCRNLYWQPYSHVHLFDDDELARIKAPYLPSGAELQDRLIQCANDLFQILGRAEDMVKIGGKRASLTDINRKLRDIPGIKDGFCFIQNRDSGEPRLAAVVVGALDKNTINRQLAKQLDEIFLPRKLYKVDNIPRNSIGKLQYTELEDWLRKHSSY